MAMLLERCRLKLCQRGCPRWPTLVGQSNPAPELPQELLRRASIESPFAVLQKQLEVVFWNTVEFPRTPLDLVPEDLDAVDISIRGLKFEKGRGDTAPARRLGSRVLANDHGTKHPRPFMGKANVSIDARLAEGVAEPLPAHHPTRIERFCAVGQLDVSRTGRAPGISGHRVGDGSDVPPLDRIARFYGDFRRHEP